MSALLTRLFGHRWPLHLGTLTIAYAALEAIFRDYQRATFLLVLGGLTVQTWWLGALTDALTRLRKRRDESEAS